MLIWCCVCQFIFVLFRFDLGLIEFSLISFSSRQQHPYPIPSWDALSYACMYVSMYVWMYVCMWSSWADRVVGFCCVVDCWGPPMDASGQVRFLFKLYWSHKLLFEIDVRARCPGSDLTSHVQILSQSDCTNLGRPSATPKKGLNSFKWLCAESLKGVSK